MEIIELLVVGFWMFCNAGLAVMMDHSEMRKELVIEQSSKIARVCGTIFYLPALLVRGAFDLLLNF